MRRIETPEGLFVYDRKSGLCLHTPDVKSKVWLKPLYAQVAVTSRCNLHCWWCYTSSSANGQDFPLEDLKTIIAFFDDWGLLGVALGGGEPFLYPHLVEVTRWTWQNTGLDISITTNGTIASERQIRAIEGFVGEVRVSIYGSESCKVLKKFLRRKFDLGVNMLLVKGSVLQLEKTVETCMGMGVKNFLINSFRPVGRGAKRFDLEPTAQDYIQFCRVLEKHMGEAEFKVSGRMAEALKRFAKLRFIPFDSEANGRVIAITVDGKVKPSSLSEEEYQFRSPEEIPEIYNKFIASVRT